MENTITAGSTWFTLMPSILCAIILFYVPGYFIARCTGTRRSLSLAIAPVLSILSVLVTALVLPSLGIPWGILPLIVTTVLIAVPCLLLRLLPRTDDTVWSGKMSWLFAGVALGGGIHAARLMVAIPNPESPSQTFDAIFHLNLVASMLANADASPLHANITTYGTSQGFYPAVWHEFTTLLIQISGISIPAAANVMMVVISAVIWPISVSMLVGWALRSYSSAAVTGAVSCLIPAMPTLYNWFGLLYPNLLSYSVLPAMFLIVAAAFLNKEKPAQRIRMLILGILALPGFFITHPSGFFAYVVLLFPLLTYSAYAFAVQTCAKRGYNTRQIRWAGRFGALSVVLLYFAVERATMHIGPLAYLRSGTLHWYREGSYHSGVGRALTLTGSIGFHEKGIIPFVIGALVILGAYASLKHYRSTWLVYTHVMSIVFFVLAWALESPQWRVFILGLWYADVKRFEALLGVTGVPLLAFGVMYLAQLLSNKIRQRDGKILVITTLAVVLTGHLSVALNQELRVVTDNTTFDDFLPHNQRLLSEDEYTLIHRLDRNVPAGSTIIGDPWTGVAYTPAYTSYSVVFPHVGPVDDPDGAYLAKHLNQAKIDPKVCEIVRRRQIYYVLDFRHDYLWGPVHDGHYHKFDGLRDLNLVGVAEIIDRERAARLLRITACD